MQPVLYSDHTNWKDAKGWLASPGQSQQHPLRNSTFLEGQKTESTWVSASSQVDDDPGRNHQHYMLHQFTDAHPIPLEQPFGLPQFVTSPLGNVSPNSVLSNRPDFTASELGGSPNDNFSRNYAMDWHFPGMPVEVHVKQELPPTGQWNYGSSEELGQPCPPGIYPMEAANVSAVDQPNYPKPIADRDSLQPCSGPQTFSAYYDLGPLPSDLEVPQWRRAVSTAFLPGTASGGTRVYCPPCQRRRLKRQTSTEVHNLANIPPHPLAQTQNSVTPGNTLSSLPGNASILRPPSPGSGGGGQYMMPKQNVKHILLEKFRHDLERRIDMLDFREF